MAFSLLYDLTLRAIIIIALTDAIIFYLMSARRITVERGNWNVQKGTWKWKWKTWKFTTLVIAVTLIPLLINIWFVLWRYGVLNVH